MGLPPLDELIPLVSHTRPPRDGSQTPDGPAPFVISPATDYIAMGHSADLLARALTSTRDYLTSPALATTWVCDLQQIETLISRLAAQIRESFSSHPPLGPMSLLTPHNSRRCQGRQPCRRVCAAESRVHAAQARRRTTGLQAAATQRSRIPLVPQKGRLGRRRFGV